MGLFTVIGIMSGDVTTRHILFISEITFTFCLLVAMHIHCAVKSVLLKKFNFRFHSI